MSKKEKDVWQHYTDYLKEATRMQDKELSPLIENMRNKVQSGCSRQELKALMCAAFEPINAGSGAMAEPNGSFDEYRTGSI